MVDLLIPLYTAFLCLYIAFFLRHLLRPLTVRGVLSIYILTSTIIAIPIFYYSPFDYSAGFLVHANQAERASYLLDYLISSLVVTLSFFLADKIYKLSLPKNSQSFSLSIVSSTNQKSFVKAALLVSVAFLSLFLYSIYRVYGLLGISLEYINNPIYYLARLGLIQEGAGIYYVGLFTFSGFGILAVLIIYRLVRLLPSNRFALPILSLCYLFLALPLFLLGRRSLIVSPILVGFLFANCILPIRLPSLTKLRIPKFSSIFVGMFLVLSGIMLASYESFRGNLLIAGNNTDVILNGLSDLGSNIAKLLSFSHRIPGFVAVRHGNPVFPNLYAPLVPFVSLFKLIGVDIVSSPSLTVNVQNYAYLFDLPFGVVEVFPSSMPSNLAGSLIAEGGFLYATIVLTSIFIFFLSIEDFFFRPSVAARLLVATYPWVLFLMLQSGIPASLFKYLALSSPFFVILLFQYVLKMRLLGKKS